MVLVDFKYAYLLVSCNEKGKKDGYLFLGTNIVSYYICCTNMDASVLGGLGFFLSLDVVEDRRHFNNKVY